MICPVDCDFSQNKTKEHLLQHVRQKIPTKILSSQCNLLPNRDDFLDPQAVALFATQIKNKKPLLFMPTALEEKKDYVGSYQNKRTFYVVKYYGILPCGSNICVKITGIQPSFSVKVPNGQKTEEFINILKGKFYAENVNFNSMDVEKLYPFLYFSRFPLDWVDIKFDNLEDRRKALKSIELYNSKAKTGAQWMLAFDDANYVPKVARERRFRTGDWNLISDYTMMSDDSSACKYNISVDVSGFNKLSNKKRKDLLKHDNLLSKALERDPFMVCSWDIETHRTIENGVPPTPQDTDWDIFTICCNYYNHHSATPLLTVCTTSVDTGIRSGVDITIVSDPRIPNTEKSMLEAHCEHLGRMKTNAFIAFNGGNFDWPLVIEKLKRNSLLVRLKTAVSHANVITSGNYAETEEGVLKWNFKDESLKINAELTMKMKAVAQFPGVLDVDILPQFMAFYPRNEVGLAKSLNFFLEQNGLSSKEDMPYKLMFRIYERAKELAKAPKHCHCNYEPTVPYNTSLPATLKESNNIQSNNITMDDCECCKSVKPPIDCVLETDAEDFNDRKWSSQLRDNLLDNGRVLCCYCGKRPQNMKDMSDVNYYCYIDCQRPQELCVKRTVFSDRREVASQSYVPLYDAFYRANGSKVRNFLGKYARIFGIAFRNGKSTVTDSQKDHYPGAWVFPPIRGLHRRRPITGLDFASLYPSLMMTYSLSPEMIVEDPAEAEELMKLGYTLHPIGPFSYEKGVKKGNAENQHLTAQGWTVRHNGIHKPSDTHIVSEYVKMVELTATAGDKTIKKRVRATEEEAILNELKAELPAAKISRRVGYDPIRGREKLPNERMGVMAYSVKKLFDKRVPIKAEFVKWSKLKERMEADKVHSTEIEENGVKKTITIDEVIFRINKTESKQKAIKLLANTFYGESGNFRSSIYKLLVAAGVTTAGQANIKKVEKFVAEKGFITTYGDTDSLYLMPPDRYFIEIDAEFDAKLAELAVQYDGVLNTPTPQTDAEKEYHKARGDAREAYWYKMVEITMKVMLELKEQVSDYLLSDNHTCFLNMAYEEVGMPCLMCGKKKYAMVPHQETINFHPEDLFLRGIDFIKQGQTMLAKDMGLEFLFECLSPYNERDAYDIALDKIRNFYKSEHDIKDFILSAKYRPDKQNVPVKTFARRMAQLQQMAKDPVTAALYAPPEPGDKFKYVIVKKEARFSITGNKIEIKKGDKMEYVSVYLASQDTADPMEIDISHYMERAIVGLFARFIAYYKDFQPPEGQYDPRDKEQYKKLDIHCITEASKFLNNLCIEAGGESKTGSAETGKKYKKIYKDTVKSVKSYVYDHYGGVGNIVDSFSTRMEDSSAMELAEFAAQVDAAAEIEAQRLLLLSPPKIPEGDNIYRTRYLYNDRLNGILARRREYVNYRERVLKTANQKILRDAIWVIYQYESRIILKIENSRTLGEFCDDDLDQIASFTEEDVKCLDTINKMKTTLAALKYIRYHSDKLMKMLDDEVAKVTPEPIKPALEKIKVVIPEKAVVEDYIWK